LARLQNSFADRVLALNVSDPAMGSGHFLVEATDYLARRIVEAGVVSEALVNGDEESELSYWRRRVVERCIYGVDLNPLAVELAKLSLWLATVAKGKPLSFLDHHLRCGNSLIGARVADLQALPVRKKGRKTSEVSETSEVSQLALWDESAFTQDMFRVVGAMQQIQEYETADLVTVQEKERLFAETVERERRKWRDIADLWTATYFGLELTPELYNACVQYAQGKPVLLQAAQAEALLDQAHQIWEEKRFFHWEIEFPEVFFDRHGQHKGEGAGFDAVVGNPPYGDILASVEKDYLLSVGCKSGGSGNNDVFRFFAERGVNLLSQKKRLGFIIPNSCLGGAKYRNFRMRISEISTLQEILDFKTFKHFDADVFTCILLLQATLPTNAYFCRYIASPEGKIESQESHELRVEVSASDTWLPKGSIYEKIHGSSNVLRFDEVCESKDAGINYQRVGVGWQSRTKSKIAERILYEGKQQNTKDYQYLKGEDIDRFSLCPTALRWLRHNYAELVYEGEVVSVNHEWAQKPFKILTRQTGDRIIATLDSARHYTGRSLHSTVVTQEEYSYLYILAILNSTFISYYYNVLAREKGRALAQVKLKNGRQLPIRRIEFTTPAEERARLVGAGITEATEWIENTEGASVDSVTFSAFSDSKLGRWLDARLSAEPEQADVVHDLLAHLAERMIEMHQQKQAEVKGFLGWLADYTGRPVDAWVLKTILRQYYEHDWAEMQRILKRNQRKLPQVDLDVDAYQNEPAQKIREAWETSMDTLRPLLKDIEATDRLIDRIVYRLYGLTEEEVGVVEGRGV
jgi:hypothetical protein